MHQSLTDTDGGYDLKSVNFLQYSPCLFQLMILFHLMILVSLKLTSST
jgi:hypothetical protein